MTYIPSMRGYYPIANPYFYSNSIRVDWSDWPGYKNKDVIGYEIYASVEATCTIQNLHRIAVNVKNSPYIIHDMPRGKLYSIRVKPIGLYGDGDPSEAVSSYSRSMTFVEYSDANPTELGEIVWTGTEQVIDNCDAVTAWSAHSGSPTFSINATIQTEGAGCLRITIPADSTVISKATFAALDISTDYIITLRIRRPRNVNSTMRLYFSEAADVTAGEFLDVVVDTERWHRVHWIISAIAAASRNAVITFGISMVNESMIAQDVYVDEIHSVGTILLKIYGPTGVKNFTLT